MTSYGYLPDEIDFPAAEARMVNYLDQQPAPPLYHAGPQVAPERPRPPQNYLDQSREFLNRAIPPHFAAGMQRATEFLPGPTDVRDFLQGAAAAGRGEGVGDLGWGAMGFLPGGDMMGAVGKAMFAGMGARRMGMEGPSTAARRLGAGDAPADVWKDTGWFRGADGKMRFEIDDSQALGTTRFSELFDTVRHTGKADHSTLSNVLHHPDLFEQYPFLKGIAIRFNKASTAKAPRGSFDPSRYIIDLNISGRSQTQIKSTLLHEIQHAVQEMEEFARGASPERIAKMLKARGRADLAKDPDRAYEGYRRMAGEVEARATQAREGMTAEIRRRIFPVQSPTAPATEIPTAHAFMAEDMPRRMQVVSDRAGRTRRAVEAGERR